MRLFRLFLVATLIFPAGIIAQEQFGPEEATVAPQKRERALVISGNNLNIAVFLGIAAGLKNGGKPVDLIVSSFGGASIAAGIMNAYPNNPDKWFEIIESKEFWEFLKSAEYKEEVGADFLGDLGGMFSSYNSTYEGDGVFLPNLFDGNLMSLGNPAVWNQMAGESNAFLDVPFGTEMGLILVAAELDPNFSGGKRMERGEKAYTETYFVDPRTAPLLEGAYSTAGVTQTASLLQEETQIITDVSVGTAVRASIADSKLMRPMTIGDRAFTSGAFDSMPIRTALRAAEEVVIVNFPSWGGLEQVIFKNTFQVKVEDLRTNQLGSRQLGEEIAAVVAWEGQPEDLKPTPDVDAGSLLQGELDEGFRLGDNVPADYDEYKRIVSKQLAFGQTQGVTAARADRGSTEHLFAEMEMESQQIFQTNGNQDYLVQGTGAAVEATLGTILMGKSVRGFQGEAVSRALNFAQTTRAIKDSRYASSALRHLAELTAKDAAALLAALRSNRGAVLKMVREGASGAEILAAVEGGSITASNAVRAAAGKLGRAGLRVVSGAAGVVLYVHLGTRGVIVWNVGATADSSPIYSLVNSL